MGWRTLDDRDRRLSRRLPADAATAPPAPVAPAATGPDAPPLVGTDDMSTPYWIEIDQLVSQARLWSVLAAVPRVAVTTARWSWRVGPSLTVLAGLLQLLAGRRPRSGC